MTEITINNNTEYKNDSTNFLITHRYSAYMIIHFVAIMAMVNNIFDIYTAYTHSSIDVILHIHILHIKKNLQLGWPICNRT